MSRIEKALQRAKAARQRVVGEVAGRKLQQETGAGVLVAEEPVSEPDRYQIPDSHIVQVDDKQLQQLRVIAGSERDERVGPYRQLRTQILKTMRDNRWSTLAITSPNVGAGKSLTATNLAISLAKDVRTTVMLVDLDFTAPTIHEKLNLHIEKGLIDFLEDRADLEEILFDPGFERLTVLVGRPAGKYSSELLASPKMDELMRNLCKQDETDVTIFDLPTILRNDDALLFTPYADATLIVVEDGVTTEDQLEQAMQLLKKVNVIGTVLNKSVY